MPEKDAIILFRLIAKERNRIDLLRLSDQTISSLVNRVKCYPLLIKWSIGLICLGKDLDSSFSQILDGESEIAKFSFEDVFKLLSDNSKTILYSMIVFGEKPISKYVLMHLSNLDEDQFEDSVKELILTSLIIPEVRGSETELITEYSMLSLTRGFIETKLDEDKKIKGILSTRYFHLSQELAEYEKSQSSYSQSLFSLGIKTPEEKVAFNYVKAAKNFVQKNDIEKAEKNFEQAVRVAPQFSYVYSEFSKFEFWRGHYPQGLELAKKAVEVAPDNYHAWFNYGIYLRKNQQLSEAVLSLIKAKELNPNHLPIYNELGRAYTFLGEYDKAESEFNAALKEEKYPNYRHKIMTLQFKADNYRRWAGSFLSRKDTIHEIESFKKAFDTIIQALDIDKKDRYLWRLYREICKDLGIALSIIEGFNYGRPYLEKSIQTMYLEKSEIKPEKKIISDSCFYLAALSLHEKAKDPQQIESWINLGLNNCHVGSKQYEKLNSLLKELKNESNNLHIEERIHGTIRFYNSNRKFGLVDTNGKSYIFFLSGFRDKIEQNAIINLGEKKVSFLLQKDQTIENRFNAIDIIFE